MDTARVYSDEAANRGRLFRARRRDGCLVDQDGVEIFFDLVGEVQPGLRHVEEGEFAGRLQVASDLDAIGGVQPVTSYQFAGRHPIPTASFDVPQDKTVARLLCSYAVQ
jgi:hypothetical protein